MIPIGDDNRDRRSTPYVTYTLVALNVLVFLYMLTLGGQSGELFVDQWGVIPARFTDQAAFQAANPEITSPLYFTLISAMFLHGGWLHIGGNMLFLWVFGDNVEDAMGHLRFIIFYLIVGIAGNLTHIFFNQTSVVPSIGASGAIAGVLGGYIVLRPRGRVRNLLFLGIIFIPFTLPAWIVIGYWFVLQALSGIATLGMSFRSGGASGDNIAYWAHIGGFVAGVLLIRLFTIGRPRGSGTIPAPRPNWGGR
jgi:membrane associated rhomboid family serine protease